jgi:3-deoxy-manno-octulosonate cytidylyltransferase (CMP-KDO synthetase)
VPFHVVIPARYASTRLPGKPLLDIGGRTMIQRVVEQAAASGAGQVLVATDDERIALAVHDPRKPSLSIAVMTVVNVQGDEPFVPPRLINQVAGLLARDPVAAIATLATPIESLRDFLDPNVVKVVFAAEGAALYFSRAPIPWSRDGAAAGLGSQTDFSGALRHVGLYAYRVGALKRITAMAPSAYEQAEKLEQLRALQAGLRIAVALCAEPPGPGVDTDADLQRARSRAAMEPGAR